MTKEGTLPRINFMFGWKFFYFILIVSIFQTFFVNCWANPLFRPPTECLLHIPNYLCPKDKRSAFWGTLFYLSTRSNQVSITNLSDHSLVQTGFLVGRAESDVLVVSISLDQNTKSFVSVKDGTWNYQLPAIASTGTFWTLGSRHTITVQGFNEYGLTGIEKTIQVIKDINLDANGDGFPDLFVAASLNNAVQGHTLVYHSHPDTGIPSDSPDTTITDGQSSGTYFGSSVGAGDFNGDGYADMIVGSQAYGGAIGRGYIFLSSGSSGISSQNLNNGGSAGAIFTGVSGAGRLGANVMGGDLNHDGFDDAIFFSPWNDETFIFFSQGSSGFISQTTATASRSFIPGANDNFGTRMAIGDINADGYADMAISAGTYSSNQGRVYIYISNAGVLPASPQQYLLGPSPDCTTSGCSFGTSLLLTDYNGDKCADLGLSGTSYNTNQGIVYLFHSNCSSSSPFVSTPNATLIGPSNSSCSSNTCFFGSSLSAGDVNGDGFPEMLVGSPNANSGQGSAYLFQNQSGVISSLDISAGASATATLIGIGTSTNFSYSLKLQDMSGDGRADFFVTAPLANKIYFFKSLGTSGPGNVNLNQGDAASLVLTFSSGQSLGNLIAIGKYIFPNWIF